MSVKRKAGQHQAQIRQIKRDIFINTPIIAGCLIATICAYIYHWHIVVRVFLTLVSFMQLMRLPSLFTRLQDQKKKLVGIETKTEK